MIIIIRPSRFTIFQLLCESRNNDLASLAEARRRYLNAFLFQDYVERSFAYWGRKAPSGPEGLLPASQELHLRRCTRLSHLLLIEPFSLSERCCRYNPYVVLGYIPQTIMANSTSPICYSSNRDNIRPDNDVPDPWGGSTTNTNFCCVNSHCCTEYCLWHLTETVTETSTSGYYVGGCTGETFSDPACNNARCK